jgi:hypothetical protein
VHRGRPSAESAFSEEAREGIEKSNVVCRCYRGSMVCVIQQGAQRGDMEWHDLSGRRRGKKRAQKKVGDGGVDLFKGAARVASLLQLSCV